MSNEKAKTKHNAKNNNSKIDKRSFREDMKEFRRQLRADIRAEVRGDERIVKMDKLLEPIGDVNPKERTEENIRVAEAILTRTVITKSLRNLEATLVKKPNFMYKEIIGMYVYYCKSDKVSNIFYPKLFEQMTLFEESLETKELTNPYYATYRTLEYRRDSKQIYSDFLMEARYYINKMLEDNPSLSLRQLSEASKVRYSNLYNFLKKNKEHVNHQKIHKVLWILYGYINGWTMEQSLEQHKSRIDQIYLHWNVDIDKEN